MNKININGLTQGCTAEQLNAIAWNILHRKGDVDMSGSNVTITPPRWMGAFTAGIIVKCASEHNGTVNISGATEIDDETWAKIRENGMPYGDMILTKAGCDINEVLEADFNGNMSLSSIVEKYPNIASILASKGLHLYEGLPTTSTAMFLSDETNSLSDYENAYNDVLASSAFTMTSQAFTSSGSYNWRHAFIIFKPTVMPTGFTIAQNDTLAAFINGVQVATDSESGTISKDLSAYIKLNQWNLLQLRCYHTYGGSTFSFGFTS